MLLFCEKTKKGGQALLSLEFGKEWTPAKFRAVLVRFELKERLVIRLYPETPNEARMLIKDFVRTCEARKTQLPSIVHWVGTALARIVSDDKPLSAEKALSLKQEKRGRPVRTLHRNAEIVREMRALRDSGKTILEASLDLAEKYGIHEANIQKIYSQYKTRFVDF